MVRDPSLRTTGPKSICRCGHTGDGDNSEHTDVGQPGHGGCRIHGCRCDCFVWNGFTPEFEAKLLARSN